MLPKTGCWCRCCLQRLFNCCMYIISNMMSTINYNLIKHRMVDLKGKDLRRSQYFFEKIPKRTDTFWRVQRMNFNTRGRRLQKEVIIVIFQIIIIQKIIRYFLEKIEFDFFFNKTFFLNYYIVLNCFLHSQQQEFVWL